ncbi:hypothetical protein BDY21DRAFT_286378 [Lineolata rhizophorae]|uniref:FUN14 family-domain-containing protein n=1 Tax=Lineolata rhizophorae TaxID=578093 RepID=A0A6A6P130_9PEZI|nr:hypothetical protein BDY21DRAFT_286378 [Lineolata rhizophorae]
MASFPFSRRLPFTLGLSTSAILAAPVLLSRRRLFLHQRCDATAPSSSANGWSYSKNAQAPVVQRGRLNPCAVRQISMGSIAGVFAGLTVSALSKPLAILIGLLVLGIQFVESRGFRVIPYERIQKYFTSMDVRSTLQDNLALKVSFGSTFLLAAFAEL